MKTEFIYCSKCGTRNFSEDKVCGVCKAKLIVLPKVANIITTKKPVKISIAGWILLIIIAFVCYAVFSDENKSTKKSNQIVYNNSLDASVSQVEDYLKVNLNDPSSYDPVSWSEVFKLNDTKEIGFACFQVRHKYRAKNEFGAIVLQEKLFRLDYQGNIVDLSDFNR